MGMGKLDNQLTEFFYSLGLHHASFYAYTAQLTIYLVPIILVILLFLPQKRLTSLKVGGGALIAWLVLSQLIGYVCFYYWGFRLRPFTEHGITELFFERPEKAFPSDHAAVLAVMTIGLFVYKEKRLGYLMLMVALVGSLTRVLAGFHWVGDILAGWLIGLLTVGIVWSLDDLANKIGKWLLRISQIEKQTNER